MKYYGVYAKDKSLKHYKYLKREWKNGGWKYYYEDSENPTGIKETRAEKLAKTRQAGAASARNKAYAEYARKTKEAEEARKKVEAEAAKQKATVTDAQKSAEERARARDERIAAKRDAAYRERLKKKQKVAIKRGMTVANQIISRNYLK